MQTDRNTKEGGHEARPPESTIAQKRVVCGRSAAAATDVLVADLAVDFHIPEDMENLEDVIVNTLNKRKARGVGEMSTSPPVRVQIIRHARTHSVGKSQSCMF